uniref:Transcription initiation factor TFIID subunit 13 n=1 Tax=Plectus sambesii TaxID=2011161 RepID=A0A914WK15_9BILA
MSLLDDVDESLFESSDFEDDEPTTSDKRKDGKSGGDEKKGCFRRELRSMVYGFGDDKVPYAETIEILDEIVVEYVRLIIMRAMDVGKSGKVTLEDIHYLIRRDVKKYGRVKDLLSMSEELKKARKAFDEAKY